MGELQKVDAATSGQVVRGGAAASTAGIEFTGTVVAWSDLPDHVLQAVAIGGSEAAAAVDVTDRRVKHRDDHYWQRWSAWRATREGIVVAVLRRGLTPTGRNRFKPTTRIALERVETFGCAKPPARRQGTVSVPDDRGQPTGGEPAASAARWLDYLPASVSQDALAAVEIPTFEHGDLIQWSNKSGPHKQHVFGLRLDASRRTAIVVSGVRDIAGDGDRDISEQLQTALSKRPWTVTRYSYALDTGQVHRQLSDRQHPSVES